MQPPCSVWYRFCTAGVTGRVAVKRPGSAARSTSVESAVASKLCGAPAASRACVTASINWTASDVDMAAGLAPGRQRAERERRAGAAAAVSSGGGERRPVFTAHGSRLASETLLLLACPEPWSSRAVRKASPASFATPTRSVRLPSGAAHTSDGEYVPGLHDTPRKTDCASQVLHFAARCGRRSSCMSPPPSSRRPATRLRWVTGVQARGV